MKRTAGSIPVSERLSLLSEPVRLRILRLLEGEELSVGEVARVVQLPQSTVSRHLKVLGEGEWLLRRAAGTATYYRLVHDDLHPDARALWITVRDQLGQSLELAEDSRRLDAVLAERPADTQAFFGRIAGEWDRVRGDLFGERFTPVALLSLLPRDWVVADLGCGTGDAAEWLAPRVERVIAIDRSDAMLKAATKRLKGLGNVETIAADLGSLPLESGCVDAAACLLVLHHLPNPGDALAEMSRVLRRDRGGGIALVVDMVEHDRAEYRQTMGHVHLGFSREHMTGLFVEAGFEEPTFVELPSDPDGKGPGLFAATARTRSTRESPSE